MLRTIIFLVLLSIGVVALGARNREKNRAKCLNWKMVESGPVVIEQL